MSEYKYLKDGRKVAVVGRLNNNQWIVQEIFVSGDQEFPCGEHFVETTLLDKPPTDADVKEYRARKNKEDYINIRKKIAALEKELADSNSSFE